jgi:predicted DNA-binding transcriptional regulator AlpA
VTTDENNFEPLLDAKEVQHILKCSLPYVYKLVERGQIPCCRWACPGDGKDKPRSMVRFKKADILEFIEAHYASTT